MTLDYLKQVIKPPVLLELSGPLFMSCPALNHIEVKLSPFVPGSEAHTEPRTQGPALQAEFQ